MKEMTERTRAVFWAAVNRYTKSCGGDPSNLVYGNTERQIAVAEVEAAVGALIAYSQYLGDRVEEARAAAFEEAHVVRTDNPYELHPKLAGVYAVAQNDMADAISALAKEAAGE